MKKLLIILLSILTLTACTPQTEEVTPETSAAASTADEINQEKSSAVIKISPYEKELTFEQQKLAESLSLNIDRQKLEAFLKERAEFYGTDENESVNILLTDMFFYDFDKDGSEELLTRLEFDMVTGASSLYYAVCYADTDKAEFITNGIARHRNTHFAFADSQPFVVIAETGMGFTEPPVIKSEQVFTFDGNSFTPYTDDEKDIYIHIKNDENTLYLFDKNTDGSSVTEKINRNEYAQSLSFKDGRLSVVS